MRVQHDRLVVELGHVEKVVLVNQCGGFCALEKGEGDIGWVSDKLRRQELEDMNLMPLEGLEKNLREAGEIGKPFTYVLRNPRHLEKNNSRGGTLLQGLWLAAAYMVRATRNWCQVDREGTRSVADETVFELKERTIGGGEELKRTKVGVVNKNGTNYLRAPTDAAGRNFLQSLPWIFFAKRPSGGLTKQEWGAVIFPQWVESVRTAREVLMTDMDDPMSNLEEDNKHRREDRDSPSPRPASAKPKNLLAKKSSEQKNTSSIARVLLRPKLCYSNVYNQIYFSDLMRTSLFPRPDYVFYYLASSFGFYESLQFAERKYGKQWLDVAELEAEERAEESFVRVETRASAAPATDVSTSSSIEDIKHKEGEREIVKAEREITSRLGNLRISTTNSSRDPQVSQPIAEAAQHQFVRLTEQEANKRYESLLFDLTKEFFYSAEVATGMAAWVLSGGKTSNVLKRSSVGELLQKLVGTAVDRPREEAGEAEGTGSGSGSPPATPGRRAALAIGSGDTAAEAMADFVAAHLNPRKVVAFTVAVDFFAPLAEGGRQGNGKPEEAKEPVEEPLDNNSSGRGPIRRDDVLVGVPVQKFTHTITVGVDEYGQGFLFDATSLPTVATSREYHRDGGKLPPRLRMLSKEEMRALFGEFLAFYASAGGGTQESLEEGEVLAEVDAAIALKEAFLSISDELSGATEGGQGGFSPEAAGNKLMDVLREEEKKFGATDFAKTEKELGDGKDVILSMKQIWNDVVLRGILPQEALQAYGLGLPVVRAPAHATLLLRHKSKADLWVPLKVHEAVDVQRAEMENNTDSSSESDHNHHYDYLFEWRKSYLEEEIGQVFLSVGDDVLFTSNDKPFAVPEHKFGGKASKIFRKQQLHTSGTTSSSSSSSSTTNPPGSNGSRLSNYLKYVYARKARKFPKLHWIQNMRANCYRCCSLGSPVAHLPAAPSVFKQKLLTNEQSAAQWLFLKQANDIVFRVCGLRPKFFDSTNSSYDLMLLGEKRILSRVSSNVSHDEPTTRAVYAGWEGSEVAFDFLIVYVHKQLDPARSQNKGAKSKWVKPNADAADGGESPSLPSNWQRSRSHRSEHVSVGAAAAGAPASVLNGVMENNVNGAAGGGSAGAAADSAWQRQYYIDLHDSHAKFLTILRRGPDGLEDTPEGAARD
eukprot:g3341.t1